MKKIFIILAYIISGISIIITAALYTRLPDKIPMHWNIQGVVDNYGSKPQAFFLPLFQLGIIFLLKFLPKADPKRENYPEFQVYYDIFILTFSIFFFIMQIIILKSAFEPELIKMNNIMPLLIGLFFCVTGAIMPKFSHNYFVGIKLPWTLASGENWKRTHKLAGPVWIAGGALTALTGFIFKENAMYISIVIMLIMVFIPVIYSYILFMKKV